MSEPFLLLRLETCIAWKITCRIFYVCVSSTNSPVLTVMSASWWDQSLHLFTHPWTPCVGFAFTNACNQGKRGRLFMGECYLDLSQFFFRSLSIFNFSYYFSSIVLVFLCYFKISLLPFRATVVFYSRSLLISTAYSYILTRWRICINSNCITNICHWRWKG